MDVSLLAQLPYTICHFLSFFIMTHRLLSFVVSILAVVVLSSCQNPAPLDYTPEYFVEAYIVVDAPLQNVFVGRTQSLTDSVRAGQGAVTDAQVQILEGEGANMRTYTLRYLQATRSYALADSTIRVKPATRYRLQIRTADGANLTGTTFTPNRIQWTQSVKPILYYPQDTLALISPDSLSIEWTAEPNTVEYLLASTCLDTLEYGKYLVPATTEKNRRIERSSESYDDVTNYDFLQNNSVPTVWTSFKWFGRHTITVYAPDRNFLNWFKLTKFQGNPSYNPLFGSIEGGYGVFGSASRVVAETFVVKNRP